jgi:hypothetical protein
VVSTARRSAVETRSGPKKPARDARPGAKKRSYAAWSGCEIRNAAAPTRSWRRQRATEAAASSFLSLPPLSLSMARRQAGAAIVVFLVACSLRFATAGVGLGR